MRGRGRRASACSRGFATSVLRVVLAFARRRAQPGRGMETFRRFVVSAISAAAMLWAGPARGECVAPPEPEISADELGSLAPEPSSMTTADASGAIGRSDGGRVVAPIMVNGQGPFRFIVDTGANRSV